MHTAGVDVQWLIQQKHLDGEEGLLQWLGAFRKVRLMVHEVVDAIRSSPYLPRIPVHGLVMDIKTAKLELIERGQ